jgi:hypothetical protein
VTAARPHPVTPGQGKPGPVAEPTPKGSGRLALLVLLPAGLLAVALVGLAFPALSRGVLLMVGAWCLLGVVAALLVWLGHRHSMVSAGPCVVTVAVFGVLGAAGLVVAVLRGSDDPAHHLEPGPENPWITYQPERRWRVEMPGEPAVQKEDEGEGRIATLHGFKHPATGAAFVVIHYDLDKGKPWLGTPDEALRKARDRVLAQAPRSKEKEARRCPLGEHPGMEFVLDTPGQGPIVLRTYLVRQRVYLLVVGGPGAGPGSRAAQRFLDSFTLLTPPVPTPVPATDFPDLFAYWRFNEAEGDAVADASGNGNPGRLHRPFGRAAGVEGMALQPLLPVEKTPRHEWRAGCMKMGPSPRFNFAAGTAFTYAVWVKTNSD